jgi:hypothetical protein
VTTIRAEVVLDSVSVTGSRLITMQLRYPRWIHAEFMTHRVFSRNARSSRAVPVEKIIQECNDDPAVPLHWGKNQKGMQADEENSAQVDGYYRDPYGSGWRRGLINRQDAWLAARDFAVLQAKGMAEAGYHKQLINRLLEPFSHIDVLVTSTYWENFFALRCHPDAEPHMRMLAERVQDVYQASEPVVVVNDWHLPYVDDKDREDALRLVMGGRSVEPKRSEHEMVTGYLIKMSVARCARVSYTTFDLGKRPTITQDLTLYETLMGAQPMHASPAEHQAKPDSRQYDVARRALVWRHARLHGNFRGWVQYRKTLLGENAGEYVEEADPAERSHPGVF